MYLFVLKEEIVETVIFHLIKVKDHSCCQCMIFSEIILTFQFVPDIKLLVQSDFRILGN